MCGCGCGCGCVCVGCVCVVAAVCVCVWGGDLLCVQLDPDAAVRSRSPMLQRSIGHPFCHPGSVSKKDPSAMFALGTVRASKRGWLPRAWGTHRVRSSRAPSTSPPRWRPEPSPGQQASRSQQTQARSGPQGEIEQSRAEQSRAERSRAEQSRAEQRREKRFSWQPVCRAEQTHHTMATEVGMRWHA